MSDSKHSTVTYTSVPSSVEDYSDIGLPEVDAPLSPDYMPGPEEPEQAPLSLDYVPGPEEPEQAPPSPVYLPYVPELVYPEYMPPEDDIFPAEEQPLPEDEEEDPEEDPVDYHADSTVVALPAVDHVPSKEVTEPLPQISSPSLPIPSPPPDSPTHIEIFERASEEITPTTLQRFNQRVTDLSTIVEQETTIMDRPVHRHLAVMVEREAWMAHEAWALSMDASDYAHSDVMSLRTTLVTQMIEFQNHHGLAKGPVQPNAPGEADSSS
nr:hypothetical protein [Tanacetum cinerariifolium]